MFPGRKKQLPFGRFSSADPRVGYWRRLALQNGKGPTCETSKEQHWSCTGPTASDWIGKISQRLAAYAYAYSHSPAQFFGMVPDHRQRHLLGLGTWAEIKEREGDGTSWKRAGCAHARGNHGCSHVCPRVSGNFGLRMSQYDYNPSFWSVAWLTLHWFLDRLLKSTLITWFHLTTVFLGRLICDIVVERRSAMVTKLCVEICWTNKGREWTLPILYLSQCRNRETIVLHVQQEM